MAEKKKKFLKGDEAKKLLALEGKEEPKRRTVKEQREAMYGKDKEKN